MNSMTGDPAVAKCAGPPLWQSLANAVARAVEANPEAHDSLADMLDQVEALEAKHELDDDDLRSAIRWAGYLAGNETHIDPIVWARLRWKPRPKFGPFKRLADVRRGA